MKSVILTAIIMTTIMQGLIAQNDDPYIWLEEVEGPGVLEWVENRNRESLEVLQGHKSYKVLFDKSLEIYNSDERIPAPSIQGDYIYNFWQDASHERGIWRRCTRESYLSKNPAWETLIDIDAISEKDGIEWVFKGAEGLFPDYSRFMVSLSRGGGDAVVTREFDTESRTFSGEGFNLPESKGGVSWIDINRLLVAADFGKGTMTTSGYPRQVRIWNRNTPLGDARVIYEGEDSDVGVFGAVINKPGKQYIIIIRAITFYTSHIYVVDNETVVRLDLPEDANLAGILEDQLLLNLKSNWENGGETFNRGALVSVCYPALLKGNHDISLIVEPDGKSGITSVSVSENNLILNMMTNVRNELYSYRYENSHWVSSDIDMPGLGSIRISSVDDLSDDYFFYYEDFLTPSSLYFGNAGESKARLVQSLPAYFNAEKYKVWQYEAKSPDGTMVPYFMVGSKNLDTNGKNPVLLYAYGGFEVPMLPFYSAIYGNSWLENGGVFVLANIRGGGEFGPKWHQDGLKEKRQNVFDDFHAVAEDLIKRNITSGKNLGIQGGSNGGLLVGVAFTQRPDLYGAVVCQVPLLDMKRYNKLLAGASWMGEYGNPDIPEEWEYIKKYSPYHNLEENQPYPEVFFTTSTRDDRVHPGHARKMVARMRDMGYTVYYYENTEGGHAGSSTNEQRARSSALGFSYLLMKLTNRN
jgi:prolyl oligopeptidase